MSFHFNFFAGKENDSSAENSPSIAPSSKQSSEPAEVPPPNQTPSSNFAPPRLIPYHPDQVPTLFQKWTDLGLASLSYLHRPPSTTSDRSSDLDAGVYEGGFVVWECTLDLLRYLLPSSDGASSTITSSPITSSPHQPLRVLDLGCGAGLLGCAVRNLHPTAAVDFQDFNADVLTDFTIPNFHHNCAKERDGRTPNATASSDAPEEGAVSSGGSDSPAASLGGGERSAGVSSGGGESVRFISGDWADLAPLLHPSYQLILSAETIYSPASHRKLYRLLLDHLEPEGGVAYFAAKRHYFGVGGGVLDFSELVRSEGRLGCEVVWSSGEEGLARDILRITAL